MATHIKNLIEGFFTKSKEKFTVYQRLDFILDKTLDKETRKGVSIEDIHDRKLILKATSSSILYNFNLQKEDVLKMVQKEIATIKNINIKVI
jgi:hypothetical protein